MNTTLRKDHFFEMSMVGEDRTIITDVVNQGIDSRLEAFTKSEFKVSNGRLFCWIHESELQILIRRLLECPIDTCDMCGSINHSELDDIDGGYTCNDCGTWFWENDRANQLADDIVFVQYGYGTV